MSLGGHSTPVSCQLGAQDVPLGLTGNINPPRLPLTQHAHLQIKTDWNITGNEGWGLCQPTFVQIEGKFIDRSGSAVKCEQDLRILTGE